MTATATRRHVKELKAPRGTADILPAQARLWQALERIVSSVCSRFGYGEIRTPIFESTDVFVRTLGEASDVVSKEMYTFADRGDRSITLRPELTAPVVRAALEHNLLQSLPLKLYYNGPIFRYERPQKGRYRQSHQWGVECFGVEGPEADAEIIAIGLAVLRASGVHEYRVEINSMGCETCRPRYRDALVEYLRSQAGKLSEISRERLERNPLRILDSKDEADRAVLAGAPDIADFWCDACRAHFERVLFLLAVIGETGIERNAGIVRGFDYYTRTVFEITTTVLGAQNAVCGGGRYDGLVQDMGGPSTPGVGLAMGMERLLLLAEASGSAQHLAGASTLDVAFVPVDEQDVILLLPVMHHARSSGIAADMDYTRRKLDRQLRSAAERGAKLAVISGSNERGSGEVTIQDLATRERRTVKLTQALHEVTRALGRKPGEGS
jgi:histidyl-tRNA synthetase